MGFFCFMEVVKALYEYFQRYPRVCTDTRKDLKNRIFFSLSGENFNGNKFAPQALEKGAVLAVVDEAEYAINNQYFLVDDCLKALQDLAAYHRNQFEIPLLGITGSNGKTTTKELIKTVLQTERNVTYTQGNLNNHIGVALSLLEIDENTEIAIIEMGANHQKEIEFLCQLANPGLGLITNIGKAHLEGFGGFEGVVKAKSELYQYIRETGGQLFVNADDELLMKLSQGIDRSTYGKNVAEVTAQLQSATGGLSLCWTYKGATQQLQTPLYGSYNMPNILAAIRIGVHFNIKAKNINKALKSFVPDNNRSQQIQTTNNQLIMDAYNANPVSMREAINSFHESNFSEPVLILGDMFELGDASAAEHQGIIDLISDLKFHDVVLIGEEFFGLNHSFLAFKETSEAMTFFEDTPLAGAHILIKGSRGMALEKLLKHL